MRISNNPLKNSGNKGKSKANLADDHTLPHSFIYFQTINFSRMK